MRWALFGFLMVACKGTEPVDSDTDTDPPASECQGLPESACSEVAGCVLIQGTPINGSSQFAGCATDLGGCDDVLTAAEAPNGTCWDFTDSCIPDGWSELGGSCADQL